MFCFFISSLHFIAPPPPTSSTVIFRGICHDWSWQKMSVLTENGRFWQILTDFDRHKMFQHIFDGKWCYCLLWESFYNYCWILIHAKHSNVSWKDASICDKCWQISVFLQMLVLSANVVNYLSAFISISNFYSNFRCRCNGRSWQDYRNSWGVH